MHYATGTAIIGRLRRWLGKIAFDRGGLLALVVLVVYLWLAPSYIVDGDNAEFSTLGVTGGAAHPPGYPLYVLYLRAMSWLPGTSGAHTAALATAILGAASVLILHAACRAWGARWGWAMLATSFLIVGPVLIARFNVPPERLGLYICQRFHLLSVVLLAVPVAVGIDQVARWLAQRISVAAPRRRFVGEALAVTVFVAGAGVSLPHLLATHSPAVEKGVVNLLKSLPEHAVLIGTADDVHFGALYAQDVLDVRPDVDVIAWTMTTLPWYRAHFAARGLAIDPYAAGEGVPSLRVARQVFASGRPLFVEISLTNILQTFPSYPHGLVFRVLPPGTAMPPLDEILEINQRLFAGFDLAYPRPDADADYAGEMHLRYARTWDILARALTAAGRKDEARGARDLVRDLSPRR